MGETSAQPEATILYDDAREFAYRAAYPVRMRTLKTVLKWLVPLVVVAALVTAWLVYKKRSTAAVPLYKTAKVTRGDVAAKVTATGTLSARVTVQVGAQVSGRVQELLADYNSAVTKGQVIARLDPRLFEAALGRARAASASARAQAQRAKANLAQAERNLTRVEKLRAESLASEADLEVARVGVETARADVGVASASVAQAAASLREAEVNLGFTTIVSPIDGTVLSRSVDVGQTVAASLSAPVLFTIAQDLRSIQVDTYVAEADVGRLASGMTATFTVDAFPGRKFTGTIREVRNAAQTVQNVVTYDAVLDVPNDDLHLKPGMTANVTFVWAEEKATLLVPNAAFRFKPPAGATPSGSGAWAAGSGRRPGGGPGGPAGPGGARRRPDADGGGESRKTIWLLRDGQLVPRRVEGGVTDGSMTAVLGKDLAEGEEVVLDTLSGDAPKTGAPPGGGMRGGRMF